MLTFFLLCGIIWLQEVMNMSKIGENIRRKREELDLSQEELATRVGYKHKASINKIELGLNDPPQNKIIQIAEVLGTTPAVLMGWTDEETVKKNDARTSIAYQSCMDKELFEMIKKISKLTPEQRQAVNSVLDAFEASEK